MIAAITGHPRQVTVMLPLATHSGLSSALTLLGDIHEESKGGIRSLYWLPRYLTGSATVNLDLS